ncbi:hypothetical protein [Corallococcus exiguus]|uniref:hypothetical protein n=1 Tax=Corallococcus exiguus TaxID=83462 RepID=UPI003DA3FF4B
MKSLLQNPALAAALTSMLAAGSASAASRVDLQQEELGAIRQRHAATFLMGGADREPARHAQALGLDANSGLTLLDSVSDHGVSNHRYQQTFRGLPIFGEHVIVNEDANGELRALFGRKVTGLERDIPARAPRLSAAEALDIAKGASLGNRVRAMLVENERSELMIYVDDDGRAHKAYVVSYFADLVGGGAPTRPMVIVDAEGGRVLKQWENLQHVLIGTGPGGNVKTGQYEYGTNYGYMDVAQSGTTCTMTNANVQTVNLNGGTSGSTPFSYTCPRNTGRSQAVNAPRGCSPWHPA